MGAPQPEGEGGRASAKSSYEVNWKLRTWALASIRAVATLAASTVVSTTEVSAPNTSTPRAVAITTSINVKPACRLRRAANSGLRVATANSARSVAPAGHDPPKTTWLGGAALSTAKHSEYELGVLLNEDAPIFSSSYSWAAVSAVLRFDSVASRRPVLNAPTRMTTTRPMIVMLTRSSIRVVPACALRRRSMRLFISGRL